MSQNGPRRDRRSSGGSEEGAEAPDDGDGRPRIPVGVIDGINDLAQGKTADVDDIKAVLKD